MSGVAAQLFPSTGERPALRLAVFTALAAFAAAHWAGLVTDPSAARIALSVGALGCGAAALALIGGAAIGRAATHALAALTALAATATGLVAIGIPAHMLAPWSWDQLAAQVSSGLSGLAGNVEYPYGGGNEWSRLVILAGLPLLVGLAGALAFWPVRRAAGRLRVLALATLLIAYGIAATVAAPDAPLLGGLVLLLLLAAWLWLPSRHRRPSLRGAMSVVIAGALALPAAGLLDGGAPWLNYREWGLPRDGTTAFEWNHRYGPLDWPRSGTKLLTVESEEPHYWKTAVLERFDGRRWARPEPAGGPALEVPPQVEEGVAAGGRLNPEWVERIGVTVGSLRSDFVVGAGTIVSVDGRSRVLSLPDGTTVTDGEPLEAGDSYEVTVYAPDPSAEQMRRAPQRYPPALARYTEVQVPTRPGRGADPSVELPVREVRVPLRGEQRSDSEAERRLAASPYRRIHQVARRLTAGAPSAYDAVKEIEAYLRDGRLDYSEIVPNDAYPLRAFLFEHRRGYCQQFSGSMAMMLRMLGIPSRIATGFSPGSPEGDGTYRVEDFDAHSWVEVYFNGIGWVPFDPTPAAAPAALRVSGSDEASAARGAAEANPRRAVTPPGLGSPAGGAASGEGEAWVWPVSIIALACALIAAVGMRARRYRSLPPAAAAEAQVRELGPALGRLDIPLRPGETLLALEARLQEAAKRTTAHYVRRLRMGRYERHWLRLPTLAERRAVRRELTRRSGPGKRLRGLLAIPPGGPRR